MLSLVSRSSKCLGLICFISGLTCMTSNTSNNNNNKPRPSFCVHYQHCSVLFAKNVRDFSPARMASQFWPSFRGFETVSEVELGSLVRRLMG